MQTDEEDAPTLHHVVYGSIADLGPQAVKKAEAKPSLKLKRSKTMLAAGNMRSERFQLIGADPEAEKSEHGFTKIAPKSSGRSIDISQANTQ